MVGLSHCLSLTHALWEHDGSHRLDRGISAPAFFVNRHYDASKFAAPLSHRQNELLQ